MSHISEALFGHSEEQQSGEGIKSFFVGILQSRPKALDDLLKSYGKHIIRRIAFCRKPIEKTVDTILNLITLGQFDKNKSKFNHDEVYHLYSYLDLGNVIIRIEKNQRVSSVVVKDIPDGCKFGEIPFLSFNAYIKNGEDLLGGNFYRYDAIKYNCQNFQWSLITANKIQGISSEFINQNASQLIPKTVSKIAKAVTDAAGIVDFVLKGGGVECY